ncbi:MAG: thymidine phosphorylase [bacterium]|nr:thymidine phosphorylase [bacterium]
MISPYAILARKRNGDRLEESEIRRIVEGAASGAWSDAQLGAFLMAAAIRGLDGEETRALTIAMLESGEQWDLGSRFPTLADKHSTGGVGDKVSLVLSPILAACGQPVVMLTGRGLGHTGGTADKLETIPGLDLDFDRARCIELLETCGMAIGMATGEVAPADRKLYALRDVTATVDSIPLITGSILSKKLATGAAAMVLDVKTGSGAFIPDLEEAGLLARNLVDTAEACGMRTSAILTDMSQPLGEWVGHRSEVLETMRCLEGQGPADLMEVTYALALEVSRLSGVSLRREDLEAAVSSGRARSQFLAWAEAQGGDPSWLEADIELAPTVVGVAASRSGYLAEVNTQGLGLALAQAGGGRLRDGDRIDGGVSMRFRSGLGQAVEGGQELATLFLREPQPEIVANIEGCFRIVDEPVEPPPLIGDHIAAG